MQSALMVPTEVLARQHYAVDVQELMENAGLCISGQCLLTGSMTAKQKREAICKRSKITRQASVIIGTHALIQEKVDVRHSLALGHHG